MLLASCRQGSGKTEDAAADSSELLSDKQILDSIQYYTFQYFWDGAEPVSGLARERFHLDDYYPQNDKNIVTSGGSGFGVMAVIVGIERNFISRQEGLERLEKIMDFLDRADLFHGACPHWWNGETGKVKPFSKKDNGADIVETAYLVQGFYALRNYLNPELAKEKQLIQRLDDFINAVEWDWFERNDVLLWHWSPEYDFEMNHEIRGYNECLITYVLAAASKTHSIKKETYQKGWARNGDIAGTNNKYGYTLDLNHNGNKTYGGPLFWAHYSFLGLDPRGLRDQYTNYWEHNVNQVMINYSYCVENPKQFEGYGENCWGLTASYSIPKKLKNNKTDLNVSTKEWSYDAHSPANDVGVISPTAALSSFPYAPEQCMKAARFFYEDLGQKLMGPYGPYDAFSLEYDWFPQRYLAIDQGPIVCMIENYRSGLLWDLFMSDPEIRQGLDKLGFNYEKKEN